MEIKTENRLTIMEQNINSIKEDINDVKTDIKNIASDIKDHIKWEGEKYEKLDVKYSGKWVEKAIISIGTALIISGLIGLVTFFINK